MNGKFVDLISPAEYYGEDVFWLLRSKVEIRTGIYYIAGVEKSTRPLAHGE